MTGISRRGFVRGGALWLAAAASTRASLAAWQRDEPAFRIGLITDLHHADKPPAMNRYYREARGRLRESVDHFNRAGIAFAVEVGDMIDSAPTLATETGYLQEIEAEYARLQAERHYVLGNHCVTGLTKAEFLAHTHARQPFYSFDHGDFHFVILDACFRQDGVPYGRSNFTWTDTDIPASQREWLRRDLTVARKPTIVFVHQRLDVADNYAVKSAPEVRAILERAGNVLAVFQGHYHRNAYLHIGGIHYCTLAAMVEGPGADNSAYAELSVFADRSLKLDGFRQQRAYDWSKPAPANAQVPGPGLSLRTHAIQDEQSGTEFIADPA
jgi:hypothetical protein